MTPPNEEEGGLHLRPVGGPLNRVFSVSAAKPALIGRAEESDVWLADPSVSRMHASLESRGGRWFIADLGSRHGTFLNGVLLKPATPAELAPGDFVRIGPFTFRIDSPASGTQTIASTELGVMPGATIERVPDAGGHSLVHRRLELLIDGAAAVHQAGTEEGLARAILELAAAGTGYERGAVLRHRGSTDEVEVVAARDRLGFGAETFSFSRSLLAEASAGHLVRLAQDVMPPLGQSIAQLRIHSAVCAPIILDTSVVGYIYLDARDQEEAGYDDAIGFCHAVSRLASLALSHLKRAELQKRQSRMEQDFNAAREAHEFLLPPSEGSVGHLAYAMEAHPGRVVAGDMFDIFSIDEDRVGVCFGDVTGQGIGAALLMTAVLSHVRAGLSRSGDPAQATHELNQFVTERSPAHVFVTFWVGVFERRDSCLRFVDAGHGHWMIKKADGTPLWMPRPTGLLIGVEPDFEYQEQRIDLEPGDRVIVYSDGVVEHRSKSGEEFGRDRLQSVITDSNSPVEDVREVFARVREFIGNVGLADDTTIASIELERSNQRLQERVGGVEVESAEDVGGQL